jgi:alkylhydroperoxidase family enzyme
MTMACWIDPGADNGASTLLDAAFAAAHSDAVPDGSAPTLDTWFLELIAADVAWLTDCEPLWQRHRARFEAALDDRSYAAAMIEGIETNDFAAAFSTKHAAMLRYVGKLATLPQAMSKNDVNAMRAAGAAEAEIVETCLAVAEAAGRVRLVRGLGIETAGAPNG